MPDDTLIVTGALARTLNLTAGDLRARFARFQVETSFESDNGTVSATFVGARLWDVIASAGIQAADSLSVEARAADGTPCLLRRDEIDPALTDRLVLVAYERDGAALLPRDGSLRLVVPGDGPGRRFLRGLTRLTVLDREPADA